VRQKCIDKCHNICTKIAFVNRPFSKCCAGEPLLSFNYIMKKVRPTIVIIFVKLRFGLYKVVAVINLQPPVLSSVLSVKQFLGGGCQSWENVMNIVPWVTSVPEVF